MATLFSFQDGDRGLASVIRMDNGDPVHITVSSTGVVVRRSRLGLLGPKLYESTSYTEAESTARGLHELYDRQLTPPGLNDPILKAFTKAVLHCSTVDDVADILSSADGEAGLEAAAVIG
jgi:hypothetical protein